MVVQPIVTHQRVFGEDVPGWFAWGLALLGTAGSVATSLLVSQIAPEVYEQLPAKVSEVWKSPSPVVPSAGETAVQPAAPAESGHPRQEATGLPPIARVPDEALTRSPSPPGVEQPAPPLTSEQARPQVALQEAEPVFPAVSVTGTQPSDLELEPEAIEPAADPPAPSSLVQPFDRGQQPDIPATSTTGETKASKWLDSTEQDADHASPTPSELDDIDCPPLFQTTSQSGSERPQAANLEAKVERLAQWLTAHPDTRLLVEGHADSKGSDEFNLLLSYRRANALAALFKRAGVPSNQLLIRAYGESEPLVQVAESAQNRRVSLVIADARACPQTMADPGNTR